MLVEKMYVRCTADKESMTDPRVFVCGQITKVDQFKKTVKVRIHDPLSYLMFFENLPKGEMEIPQSMAQRCTFFRGSSVFVRKRRCKVLSCVRAKDQFYYYYLQDEESKEIVSVDLYDDMQQAGADPKADKMARALMANDAMEDAKKFSDYLNQFVEIVIQRCAGIEPGDFEQVFMDIRKELYRIGKNLTLFIEDVTSFTGVDNALLNALMEEHNDRDICRISSVVGGTNAYINDCFRQNHRDRVTQYVYIPDDVFDECGLYEFVGRYINAMSLPVDRISEWVNNKALPGEYPVHEVAQGNDWEYIDIPHGKKLCLYPFTKNSIKYLYKNELTKGHQTPRYIIRDIIEPVVSDLLYNETNFPGKKYALVNINTTLNFMVHNQIKDEELADRVFCFMSIWGNNEQITAGKKFYKFYSNNKECGV